MIVRGNIMAIDYIVGIDVEQKLHEAEQKRDMEREAIAKMYTLVTFGFRACERGENLEQALSDALKTWKGEL